MSPLAHAILDPIVATLTIIAFLGACLAVVWFFLEKTRPGAWLKSKTAWMEWYDEEAVEDEYTNFRIHPSNYIKVPTNH